MEKVYKMPGYDLHLLPTNKFKNITISLKLQNTLDEKTVAKRTLLSFMLTTGTEKYPSTQELSIYLESMYGMKLGANVVTKGKSHIINVNSICINQEYLPYQENLLEKQRKVNQLLQYVMTLIRHYHQMTCKRKGIYNLLGMKSNLFGKSPMG